MVKSLICFTLSSILAEENLGAEQRLLSTGQRAPGLQKGTATVVGCALNLLLSGHLHHSVQSGAAVVQGAARAVAGRDGKHAQEDTVRSKASALGKGDSTLGH